MEIANLSFFVFAAAGLVFGGMACLAAGLSAYHRRLSRVARFALRPSLSIEEGPALLGGTVASPEDELPGPVLVVDYPAPPASGRQMLARPFTLALPSGAKIDVEAEEGRWSLDATFLPVGPEGHTLYEAIVRPGDVVYVRGALRRELDPRTTGKGYRDVARRWVLRGDLAFSSAAVIAAHAHRAAFHRRWALALGTLCATVSYGLGSASDLSGFDFGSRLLAVLLVSGVGFAYLSRADATAPWLQRQVNVR